MITRSFRGRRSQTASGRLPPGQHLNRDFPVLSAGATPHTPLHAWSFALESEDGTRIASWNWEEFRALGPTEITVDIHCVTHWSKFDTDWRGVSVDRIFAAAGLDEPPSPFVMAFCDGGYATNLPVEDLLDGKALIVWEYDGEPLPPEHGGAARLLVPHLYFWKSAKWVRGLRFMADNEPGFWEVNGYHSYGDPWLRMTLTRDSAPGWSGRTGRIEFATIKALVDGLGGVVNSFVCGPDGFVETASELLLQAGQPHDAIRTERFGPTGR
jgi:DMSO/TMAO reductase YedYZ molybdopterin-dependent catalytic subunit